MSSILAHLVDLRNLLSTHVLFAVGAMLLVGYAVGILAGKIGLPEVTGFIVAGVVLGDSLLGVVPRHMGDAMKVVTEVALGLIALTIGSEFSLVKLRRLGREIVGITAGQLLLTFGVVTAAMVALRVDLPFALILGAVATASSPAVVVALVQSLRARGTFVDCLYGVIALEDAGAVILFGMAFTVAAALLGLSAPGAGILVLLTTALGEVLFSLFAGLVMGVILHLAVVRKSRTNEILLITLGVAFAFTAAAIVFHLSPLLINMAAGAVLINLSPRHGRVFRLLEPLTPPIFALFFVLAGSELQFRLLAQPHILLLGGTYFVARALAKYGGAWTGAALSRAEKPVRDNVGLCMVPQAGVALGLVLLVQASPLSASMSPAQVAMTDAIVNVVLLAVFVSMFVGPPLARRGIIRGNQMEAP